ncbi:hypothetical protein N7486_003853 [Penicillium sp. IBT 16267x]|nr:hypothetical protein N7486_003853 [Penicillium sp. IBT 16267x]
MDLMPQSPADLDRHDTDPSTSWLSVHDDDANDEITPHLGTDYGAIPYPTQPETVIPIDPAILGDETAGASTHDWQGGCDSDFVSSNELLQEWGSIRDHFASTPEREPRQQSTALGVVPSYDLLDPQIHPLSGSHITETETATAPDVFRATGKSSEDMPFNKRGSPLEYDSGQPFKRVRTGTTPSEDANLPLLPTLCSQFLATLLDGRLEFLSWLFEGALARCTSAFPTAPTPSLDRAQSKGPRHRQAQHPVTTTSETGRLSFRRRRLWGPEEIELLVQLRKVEKRSWSDVVKRFTEQFPGRTAGSIQVYWSTNLKDEQ